MALSEDRNDNESKKFAEVGALGQTAIRVVNAGEDTSGASSIWQEGTTKSCTTGNNDKDLTLAAGTSQEVYEVIVSIPGAIGAPTIVFYDGAVATGTPLTSALYIAAQSPEGFKINSPISGILGMRIAGITSGTPTAYINVRYKYS